MQLRATVWPLLPLVLSASIGLTLGAGRLDPIVALQRIEDLRERHRIWPDNNPGLRPALSERAVSAFAKEQRDRTLRMGSALQELCGCPLNDTDLQRELDRIRTASRDPARLEEFFAALEHDPVAIAESLVRPALTEARLRERLPRQLLNGLDFDRWWRENSARYPPLEPSRPQLNLGPIVAADCSAEGWSRPARTAPLGRVGQTAVWTGSEMLVWGGLEGNYLNSGARYDPALDRWTPMSELGAPTGRANHTAVWTGTQMIVWGGSDHPQSFENGGRYEPAADRWLPMNDNTGVGQLSRSGHTAVWTGSEMIIFGGANLDLFIPTVWNSGSRYNPVTDLWVPLSTIGHPRARMSHSAVWTGTELIVWGGETRDAAGNVVYLGDGDRWTPIANVWQKISGGGAPSARSQQSTIWTGTRMIVWGGQALNTLFGTGGSFDPATSRWTATSLVDAPSPRSGHTAIWTGSRMIVWGGADQAGVTNSGGRFDPSNNSWQPLSNSAAPAERQAHSAVWSGTQMIVWGGSDGLHRTRQSGGRYDPLGDRWTSTAGSDQFQPEARRDHSATWTGSELIVWGGQHWTAAISGGVLYEPALDRWRPIAAAGEPTARFHHTATWNGTRMMVWGGESPPALGDGASYDPASDSWLPIPVTAGPTPRSSHSAVWTGRELVIFGGDEATGGATNSGARFDPSTGSWRPLPQTDAPSARSHHGATFDGISMLIWGGQSPFALGTGARFDFGAERWSAIATLKAPVPRTDAPLVWSGDTAVVWGGENQDGSPTGDGSRYDPFAMEWSIIATSPLTPRHGNSTTALCGRLAVWGGGDPSGSPGFPIEGAWYDPLVDSWTPFQSADAPAGRWFHTATAAGGQLIVFGGAQSIAETAESGAYCGCASLPAPAPIKRLEWSGQGEGAALRWTIRPEAEEYDVVSGALGKLQSSGGDFAVATSRCVLNDAANSSAPDPAVPISGDGYWYLVRGDSSAGPGSYDELDAGLVGSRDAEIAASAAACP